MLGYMEIKQRVYPRYAVALGAEVYWGDELHTAQTHDLSLGGVGLRLTCPLDINREIIVGLFLVDDSSDPITDTLEVSATVAWSAKADDGYDIGLRFDGLSAQRSERLAEFLRALNRASE